MWKRLPNYWEEQGIQREWKQEEEGEGVKMAYTHMCVCVFAIIKEW